jgi:hypothetical protein
MGTDGWLTATAASRATGLHVERLRSLARRGAIETRRGNAGLEIHVVDGQPVWLRPPSVRPFFAGRPAGRTDGDEDVTALKVALAVAEERAQQLDQRLAERSAAAEKEAAALRQAIYEATNRLDRERARADKAEGEAVALRDALADLSQRLDRAEERLALPWWRKLLG